MAKGKATNAKPQVKIREANGKYSFLNCSWWDITKYIFEVKVLRRKNAGY